MQLHEATNTRPHYDVPLWTTEQCDRHGADPDGINGKVLNYWREGDIVVALWESTDTRERFLIHMYENDWLIQGRHADDEMPFDETNRRTQNYWYIWKDHVLEVRP